MELAHELLARDAKNVAPFQTFFPSIEKKRFGFRIIFSKGSQTAEILIAHAGAILDFYGPKTLRPIQNKIHFHAGTRAPE